MRASLPFSFALRDNLIRSSVPPLRLLCPSRFAPVCAHWFSVIAPAIFAGTTYSTVLLCAPARTARGCLRRCCTPFGCTPALTFTRILRSCAHCLSGFTAVRCLSCALHALSATTPRCHICTVPKRGCALHAPLHRALLRANTALLLPRTWTYTLDDCCARAPTRPVLFNFLFLLTGLRTTHMPSFAGSYARLPSFIALP